MNYARNGATNAKKAGAVANDLDRYRAQVLQYDATCQEPELTGRAYALRSAEMARRVMVRWSRERG
jgi:hypothetical protein